MLIEFLAKRLAAAAEFTNDDTHDVRVDARLRNKAAYSYSFFIVFLLYDAKNYLFFGWFDVDTSSTTIARYH